MDFKTIISEILEKGWTQREIAIAVNSVQAHISCLLSGKRKTPGWTLGDALLRLHAEVCGARQARGRGVSLHKPDLHVRLSPEQHKLLFFLATLADRDLSDMAVEILEEGIVGRFHTATMTDERMARLMTGIRGDSWRLGGNDMTRLEKTTHKELS
ncbi:MAG: hypothetical protein LBD68_08315 [Zoogloeaceae bacterium]|jgi:hypothetical protein|nr:hypothetical protein [Zoogloeaceae bacterium]